ncbi:MAG: hypothetical protein WC197_05640, partial [Candidatus Gastranaerophilaceae bacterium]
RKIFTAEQVSNVHPDASDEKQLVDLRNGILNSDLIKKTGKFENEKAAIKENLDYFVASSELNTKEKVKSLRDLRFFTSDKFKVNDQLKDYKVKILSEILNDAILKKPDQDRLTGKDVCQNAHGACAEISQSRKMVPYTSCSDFVRLVLYEVSASPTMHVHDITDPELTKKKSVPKADIDYEYAMALGYRIIDAASLSWMHIAHDVPGSATPVGSFTPLDREHWGLFNDAHWVPDMPSESKAINNTLKANIKLYSHVKELDETRTKREKAENNLEKIEREIGKDNVYCCKKIENSLTQIAPLASERKVLEVSVDLYKAATEKNSTIHIQESDFSKKQKIKEIIKSKINTSDENLSKTADEVLLYFNRLQHIHNEEKELSKYFQQTQGKCIKYHEDLFKLAAFNRARIEISLDADNLRSGIAKNYAVTETNPEKQKKEILAKMENKGEILPKSVLDSMFNDFNEIDKKTYLASTGKIPVIHSSSDIFKYRQKYKSQFQKIEKDYSKTRADIIRDHKFICKAYLPQLIETYSKYGKEVSGHLGYVSQGSSGLNTPEQIRNIEKMTGNEYFATHDIKEGIKSVKEGNVAQIAYSIFDEKEYGGHAECVTNIKNERVFNPKTGKTEEIPVVYMDNTWGPKEMTGSWTSEGNVRTGYGSNRPYRGYDEGYFVRPSYAHGVALSKLTEGSVALEYEGNISKLPVFMDINIKGKNNTISNETTHMLHSIMGLAQTDYLKDAQEFLKHLSENAKPIDPKIFSVVSKSISEKIKIVLERVRGEKDFARKGIKTKEDFDKLSEDDEIKITAKKMGIIKYLNENIPSELISEYSAKAIGDSKKLKLFEDGIAAAAKILIDKSLSKLKSSNEITAKDLDSSYEKRALKKWVQNKFDPQTDEKMLEIIKDLAKKSPEEINTVLDQQSAKDLGINFGDPFDTIQRINVFDDAVTSDFTNLIHQTENSKRLAKLAGEKAEQKDGENILSEIKGMKNMFSYLGFEKMFKPHAEGALLKHGTLPSFPEVKIKSDEEILNETSNILAIFGKRVVVAAIAEQKQNELTDPDAIAKAKERLKLEHKGIEKSVYATLQTIVRPKQQEKIVGSFNDTLKDLQKEYKAYLTSNNGGEFKLSEALLKKQAALTENMLENHITKEPEEFLDHLIQKVPTLKTDDSPEGKLNKSIIENWSNTLANFTHAAELTYLESKMMDLVEKGSMHKIGREFKNPEYKPLQGIKTKEKIGICSDIGIATILSALGDDVSSNSTLKYFIQQTGLTDEFIKFFEKEFNENKVDMIKEVLKAHPPQKNEQGILILPQGSMRIIEELKTTQGILPILQELSQGNKTKEAQIQKIIDSTNKSLNLFFKPQQQ